MKTNTVSKTFVFFNITIIVLLIALQLRNNIITLSVLVSSYLVSVTGHIKPKYVEIIKILTCKHLGCNELLRIVVAIDLPYSV